MTPALKLNGTKLNTSVHQVAVGNTWTLSSTLRQRIPVRLQLLLQHLRTRAGVRARRGEGAGHPGRLAESCPRPGGFPPSASPGSAASATTPKGRIPTGTRRSSSATTCRGFAAGTRSRSAAASGTTCTTRSATSLRAAISSSRNIATGYALRRLPARLHRSRPKSAVALAVTQFRALSQAYYFTDTWKVRSNMTFDLGLRYEYTPPWLDKNGTLMNAYDPVPRHDAERAEPSPAIRRWCASAAATSTRAPCSGSRRTSRWRATAGWATAWCSTTRRTSRRGSAGRGHPSEQVVGPRRHGHLLHAGHRQPAVRHGAQPRRAAAATTRCC